MALTPKQEKFCIEYVKTGNKSEAYRLAYDADKMATETINNNAYKLFDNNEITTRIEELQNEVQKRNNIDIDWCIEKLKTIVEDNEKDRVAAVDKLMKHLGGYESDNKQKSQPIHILPSLDEIKRINKALENDY